MRIYAYDMSYFSRRVSALLSEILGMKGGTILCMQFLDLPGESPSLEVVIVELVAGGQCS